MYKCIGRILAVLMLVIIAAPGLWSGAFAMPALPDEISMGEPVFAVLDQKPVEYTFIPPSNSVYDICLFPADENPLDVQAELWQGDERIASGENTLKSISERLTAGSEYVIRLTGSGSVRMEVARHALSRCYDMPMMLESGGDEYSKAIARTGDVHWYGIIPESDMPVILGAAPDNADMRLAATLFDENGRVVTRAVQTDNGAFLLDFMPEAGHGYYIRVHDSEGGTGAYTIIARVSETKALPESIELSEKEIAIRGRVSLRIPRNIAPEDAGDILLWESSDESVARVAQNGRVTGIGPGTAYITVYAPGGLSDRCSVTVENVPVEGISLLSENIRMHVGDDISLECELFPENATDPRFEYTTAPEGIVEITDSGVVRAIGEGVTRITVTTMDGGYTDNLLVSVQPAPKRYRALLVGQQEYAATVAVRRPGSANSVNAVGNTLENLSFDGSLFSVDTLQDASRDKVIAAIRNTFKDASDRDLSLFYITCHGYYADGITFLQMADGSVLTAAELELALRSVPGEVVVMIDCCGSGGAIARSSTPDDILSGIVTIFQGNAGSSAFLSSKYKVIASAALEQDSYRVSFDETAGEAGMATVFARALCEALGWDIDTASRSAMRADVNYDNSVTFTELCNYVRRRVMWYLDPAGDRPGAYVQSVQFWPSSGTFPLFLRAG